ncbi:Transgelin-2 [Lamellibrachia satsuma]|nr:Transgelin-2 [Lamellibrachia satsuma]KAI0231824.1 Transgelin-2 [Lamellibrachia satsuma]
MVDTDPQTGKMNIRAKKAGIALQIQKKMEDGYDREESLGTPTRIVEWLNQVLPAVHRPCPDTKWRTIHFYLKDGVALCRLINILRQAVGKSAVKFSKNAATPFVAMENIESFNRAAQDYGLPETDLFQSVDLYEGHRGPLLNIINCLNRLGTVANDKGFSPRYNPPEPPKNCY